MLTRAYRDSIAFEDRFWSGGNLRDLYNELQGHGKLAAMERIFEAGFKEYMHSKVKSSPDRIVDAAHRVMRVTLSREIDALETHLRSEERRVGKECRYGRGPYVGKNTI